MTEVAAAAGGDPRSALTVVVVAMAGGEALARCRAALEPQTTRVVTVGGAGETGDGPRLSIPELRTRALREAQTRYVALIEDTAIPGADWCARACARLAEGNAAVGGAVVISPALKPRFQALGLCEYAGFQASRILLQDNGRAASDHASPLPGLGFAVDREAVVPVVEQIESGLFFETEVFERLKAAGRTVCYDPNLALTYAGPYPQGAALSTRWRHGRLFAGRRLPKTALGRRLIFALASPLLAILLTYRALKARPAALSLSPGLLFWIVAMNSAWAAGECAGYLTGDVGDGLAGWV